MRAAAAAAMVAALSLSACKRPQPSDQTDTPAAPTPPSASAPAGPAPTPAWIEWNSNRDGSPRSYQAGPFTVTLAKAEHDGVLRPVFTISDGQGAPLTLAGAEGVMGMAQAEFTLAPLDRRATGPQLLVRTFTYGAHCCFEYRLVERRADRWLVRDLGQYDAAGMPDPRDVDGDGSLELLGGDQRFLYAFNAYAFSGVAPQIQEVVDGELVDVSADPRYRPAYEADEPEARRACAENRDPGVCIPYAATMARLGRLAEAWPLVEAADPSAKGEDATTDCWGARTYCDGDRKVRVKSFRQKVELALTDMGYLPRREAGR